MSNNLICPNCNHDEKEAIAQRLAEGEVRQKELRAQECAKGNHVCGSGFFGGGYIHSICVYCGHLHSVEDTPMTL
jgi:hypothetical protein